MTTPASQSQFVSRFEQKYVFVVFSPENPKGEIVIVYHPLLLHPAMLNDDILAIYLGEL